MRTYLTAIMALMMAGAAVADSRPCIGNSTAMSGPAAFSGMTIRMGAEIAIEEINANGGVLGKSLRLIQYDDAGAPPRGVDNSRRVALSDQCIAILGGHHSTVTLAQSEVVNSLKLPFIGVAAANTKAVENGAKPNFMFRVSAKDKWVAQFLVKEAAALSKSKKIAFMYENTGWGNGAVPDVQAAAQALGIELVASETFNWGDGDMTAQVMRLRDRGADTVVLWALDREGNQILRSMDKIGYRPEIVGAWGIAGNLGELAGKLANGVRVMQTFSFMGQQNERTQALWQAIQSRYSLKAPEQIKMGSVTANAYDAVYILAKAIEDAGSFDREKVREALYRVKYDGLVANYDPAFDESDPERQDAVLIKDYKLGVWVDGKLMPIEDTEYHKP